MLVLFSFQSLIFFSALRRILLVELGSQMAYMCLKQIRYHNPSLARCGLFLSTSQPIGSFFTFKSRRNRVLT
ncbi:hypothetical protein NMG60_11029852 [Bertholletia excelsa]